MATSDKFCGQTRVWIGSRHPAAAFFLQVPKLCTELDLTLLYRSRSDSGDSALHIETGNMLQIRIGTSNTPWRRAPHWQVRKSLPVFAKQDKAPWKILPKPRTSDWRIVLWSADFSNKRVFWGEKGHDPEQSKDLETRIQTPCGSPKNTKQCKIPLTGIPNFEWRAAVLELTPLPPRAHARLLLAADMPERWPHVCRVKITGGFLPTSCFVSTTSTFVLKLPNPTLIYAHKCWVQLHCLCTSAFSF